VGFITFISLVVPLYFGEYGSNCKYDAITPILITSAVFFVFGLPLYYTFRKSDSTNFKSAMVTTALAWIIVPAIGSIPLILIPYNKETLFHMSPLSAFFESMSGWTGTGLTIVDKENFIPYTLQFWRTIIQWIGGIGVIVLTLSILARLVQVHSYFIKVRLVIKKHIRLLFQRFVLYGGYLFCIL